MKRIILSAVVIFIMIGLTFSPGKAQDEQPCDPGQLMEEMAALEPSGDGEADLNTLLELAEKIRDLNVACSGFSFTGTGNRVVGPFDIPAGFYRVRVSTYDYMFQATIVSVDPKRPCVEGFMAENLFSMLMNADNLMGSDNEAVHEASIQTAGCRMAIEVEATSSMGAKPWTMTIEPLS